MTLHQCKRRSARACRQLKQELQARQKAQLELAVLATGASATDAPQPAQTVLLSPSPVVRAQGDGCVCGYRAQGHCRGMMSAVDHRDGCVCVRPQRLCRPLTQCSLRLCRPKQMVPQLHGQATYESGSSLTAPLPV